MKKKILVLFILLVFISVNAYAFDFSSLKKFITISNKNASASYNNVISPFASINQQVDSANTETQDLLLTIVSILSSSKEANSLKSKFDNIMNKSISETEKTSMIAKLIIAYANNLKANKSDILSLIKNMSASEQQQLASTVTDFAKNGAKYLTLAKDYSTLAASLAKESTSIQETANIVSEAKQAATSLTNSASAISTLAKSITSLLK